MTRQRLVILLCPVVLLVSASLAPALEIVVSPDGPVKTLLQARDAARAYRAEHPAEAVTITLRGGYYFLAEPVTFGPEDSNLTVQGRAGEEATLGSGRRLTGWHRLEGNLWAADVPEVKAGTWDFRTLTVNGQWRRRSGLPKEGFFEHLSVYNEPWRSTTGGGFGTVPVELKRTMVYKPEDLGPWLSSANAEFVIYHSWDMSHARLEANDTEKHVLTLTPPLGYPAGAFGIKRYRVENLREGMHSPGLWYLDRENGRVVYWPLPGEDLSRAEVVAPVASSLIAISGKAEAPVRGFCLRNLTLADTNVPWKSPGFGAAGIGETAVTLAWGDNCLLSGLHLVALGGNAVKITQGDSNRLSRCRIEYVGASGVIGSGDQKPGIGDNLVIEDNEVHHVGLVYPGGIGIRTGNIANCRILRNLVHDVGYSGICFGGDMQNPRAVNGLIENNHVYRVMTALSDGAAIYVSAQLDGTVIRGNVCHDIHGLTGMGWGIYPDEQSRFLTVTGNLVYRCLGALHCHMAHDITFDNNILVDGDQYLVSLPRSKGISFHHNVFVTGDEPVFATNVVVPGEQVKASDHNLFFSLSGARPTLGKPTWEAWLAAGFDADAVFADPLFADAAHDEYTLLDASPALKQGVARLDLSRVPKGL